MQGRNEDTVVQNGFVDTAGELGGRTSESSTDVYTLSCVKQTVSGKLLNKTELSLVRGDNLEGWDGGGGSGREAQEGRNIYILTAVSHCCTAETNVTL